MSAQLDALAFRFFKLFARYEATLKQRGFFRVEGQKIVVDWDRFSNEVVGSRFLDQMTDKADLVTYLLSQPPMKQGVNQQNEIVWLEVLADDRSSQALFGHIRRMRNNLYHGAKFNGTWFDPERSQNLLRAGLAILEHYAEWLDPEGG